MPRTVLDVDWTVVVVEGSGPSPEPKVTNLGTLSLGPAPHAWTAERTAVTTASGCWIGIRWQAPGTAIVLIWGAASLR